MAATEAESPPRTAAEPAPTAPAALKLRPLGRMPRVKPAPRLSRWWLLTPVVIIALAIGSFALVRHLRSAPPAEAVTLYAVQKMSFPVILKEKGELKAAESTIINCEVEGQSTIISVIDEGTAVKKGDLLVELASDKIDERLQSEKIEEATAVAAFESAEKELAIQRDQNESDIRKAELAFELAQLDLEKYKLGDWVQQRREAELAVDEADQVLRRAEEKFETSKKLHAQKFYTKTELDADEFEYYKAKVSLEKAKLANKILVEYTHKKDLQKAESDVEEAEKELARTEKAAAAKEAKAQADKEAKQARLKLIQDRLAKLREQKEKTKIYAPGPGLVIYHKAHRWDDRRIAKGSTVHERQTLIELPDPSKMLVVVRVHESKTNQLKIGLKARVEIEGLPDREFTGEVTKIAAVADSNSWWLNPDLKAYATEIALDQTDPRLKPGITAKAEILVAELNDVLAVPVQAVFSKAGKSYVFAERGDDQPEPVEVQLGLASAEYVEIHQGLQPGQRVFLAVSDDMKLMLPETTNGGYGEHAGFAGPRP